MLLTIFTPTFNRAKLLFRTYQHLCSQTNREFLWLIIDDGSTDNTKTLVESWQEEQQISIEYHYQENGGKMAAHNKAVALCNTELFLCVDSDDYLVDKAVEIIIQTWEQLSNRKDYVNLAGIIAYKGKNQEHTMNGEKFPDIELTTQVDLYKNGFHGETTLIYRTSVLRKYAFPLFPGETFIPEAVVFDQIDRHYQMYILPLILMVCEYQPDGLTQSIDKVRRNNPRGWLLYYQTRLKGTSRSMLRYKYLSHTICFAWYTKSKLFEVVPASKLEILIGIPGAFVLKMIGKL